jgi:protein-tyrosine-phosphatase
VAGDAPEAVLFACTLNAVRSPMAAAILSHLTGARIKVASAGVKLGHPDPFAVAVMDEIGIDISEHEPTVIADLGNATFDLIITLSPEAQHHAVELTRTMAADVEHWPTLDVTAVAGIGGREETLQRYRKVRDQLFQRIKARFAPDSGPSV